MVQRREQGWTNASRGEARCGSLGLVMLTGFPRSGGIVDTTAIRSIFYEINAARLFVSFANGKTYAYDRVPIGVYQAFQAALSADMYFTLNIRDRYTGRALRALRQRATAAATCTTRLTIRTTRMIQSSPERGRIGSPKVRRCSAYSLNASWPLKAFRLPYMCASTNPRKMKPLTAMPIFSAMVVREALAPFTRMGGLVWVATMCTVSRRASVRLAEAV